MHSGVMNDATELRKLGAEHACGDIDNYFVENGESVESIELGSICRDSCRTMFSERGIILVRDGAKSCGAISGCRMLDRTKLCYLEA